MIATSQLTPAGGRTGGQEGEDPEEAQDLQAEGRYEGDLAPVVDRRGSRRLAVGLVTDVGALVMGLPTVGLRCPAGARACQPGNVATPSTGERLAVIPSLTGHVISGEGRGAIPRRRPAARFGPERCRAPLLAIEWRLFVGLGAVVVHWILPEERGSNFVAARIKAACPGLQRR
jgi:hypothetical protein